MCMLERDVYPFSSCGQSAPKDTIMHSTIPASTQTPRKRYFSGLRSTCAVCGSHEAGSAQPHQECAFGLGYFHELPSVNTCTTAPPLLPFISYLSRDSLSPFSCQGTFLDRVSCPLRKQQYSTIEGNSHSEGK